MNLGKLIEQLEKIPGKKVILEEVLPWKKVEEKRDDSITRIRYTFSLDNTPYTVSVFSMEEGEWELLFGESSDDLDVHTMTGKYKALTVMATVASIANAFMKEYSNEINVLSVSGTSAKRREIYAKIAPRFTSKEFLKKIKFA